jgi:hypothetical protein
MEPVRILLLGIDKLYYVGQNNDLGIRARLRNWAGGVVCNDEPGQVICVSDG